MKSALLIAGAATMLVIAAPAGAHEGPRIWIGNAGGTIKTFTSDDDFDPTVYTPSRIFASELSLLGPEIWQTDLPGYEVRRAGGNVSSGTTFGFNITGPLLFYDDAANAYLTVQQKFGPPQPGPVPQMAVSLSATIRFTSTGPVSGFNFFTYSAPGDHGHMDYTMVANGVPYDGPVGVYALPLSLTSAGLIASDTFYLLMGKEVSPGSPLFDEALDAALGLVRLPGDANSDGRVDIRDARSVANHWMTSADWSGGDFNGDGTVNRFDLAILAHNWNVGVGSPSGALLSEALESTGLSSAMVPEPGAGLVLMGLLGAGSLGRRSSQSR